jgi:hypothetical protein
VQAWQAWALALPDVAQRLAPVQELGPVQRALALPDAALRLALALALQRERARLAAAQSPLALVRAPRSER